MPEYITSTEGINLDSLIKERDDYVKAKMAESTRSDFVFDRYYYKPLSNSGDVICEYLVSMKQSKLAQADPEEYGFTYNKVCFLYHVADLILYSLSAQLESLAVITTESPFE